MKTKMKLRLALRNEGEFWNAYIAPHDTMQGAKLIGSVVFEAARKNSAIRDGFKHLMVQVMADAITEVTGVTPDDWVTEPAPEAERSGHG